MHLRDSRILKIAESLDLILYSSQSSCKLTGMSDHTRDPKAASSSESPLPADVSTTNRDSSAHAAEQMVHLDELKHALLQAVFETPGELDPMVRQAIYLRAIETHSPDTFHPDSIEGVPRMLSAFADKVIRYAYKVTDADISRLLDSGYSEDAVFEAIISAATGAGMVRIEQGLRAMTLPSDEEARPHKKEHHHASTKD